ncbi:hypothetical protein [Streptomyces chryseus]|nr:hypothetical protein [Streptomyces chryseus]
MRRAVTPAPRSEAARSSNNPLIPSYLRIRALAEAGELDRAAQMAAAIDDAAARANGPSHPSALEAREVHAHITAERGELSAAVALYRDVAERWAFLGKQESADEAAARAHALWMRITDPTEAVRAGEAVLRMRTQIPGENGTAYQQAARRLKTLQARQSQTQN